ncbi:hypothetical protein BJ508DRAFT_100254 [Ascobolus immersus RN42]|uniref:Uncharacterized protein n=1 Tax=Ascobolus immersus RN42 TaxID=1160509 RepID=A0A3N4ICU0_ASCIM|nr:hypothetical protein BJ508DRAFT_100254 [Ascobolus immersus RN42]
MNDVAESGGGEIASPKIQFLTMPCPSLNLKFVSRGDSPAESSSSWPLAEAYLHPLASCQPFSRSLFNFGPLFLLSNSLSHDADRTCSQLPTNHLSESRKPPASSVSSPPLKRTYHLHVSTFRTHKVSPLSLGSYKQQTCRRLRTSRYNFPQRPPLCSTPLHSRRWPSQGTAKPAETHDPHL